jgi:hypothetical protein
LAIKEGIASFSKFIVFIDVLSAAFCALLIVCVTRFQKNISETSPTASNMAKKKSAAQKSRTAAAAVAAAQLGASMAPGGKEESASADPSEHVAALIAQGMPALGLQDADSAAPTETGEDLAVPAKKKRNRRGKGSRKKKKAFAGECDEEAEEEEDAGDEEEPEGSEPAPTPENAAAPEEEAEGWVEIGRKEAEGAREEEEEEEEENKALGRTPAFIEESDADEREYLFSGLKIHGQPLRALLRPIASPGLVIVVLTSLSHSRPLSLSPSLPPAPDPAADHVDSDQEGNLDDLGNIEAEEANAEDDTAEGGGGDDGDGTYEDDEEDGEGDEEDEEMAEVLDLLVDEFEQQHGRLPSEVEVEQWRDAIASSAPIALAGAGGLEAGEAAMRSAQEASYQTSSSDASESEPSGSSDDDQEGPRSLSSHPCSVATAAA